MVSAIRSKDRPRGRIFIARAMTPFTPAPRAPSERERAHALPS